MPLVSSEKLLLDAQKGGYAVAALNIENMEMAQAVIDAAEALQCPVILQTTSSTLRYADAAVFAGIVSALAAKASIPAALHLDHGASYEISAQSLQAGYTSIMIDGSLLSFEENIAISAKVAETAKTFTVPGGGSVPVEAELGCVGGKEDDTVGGDGAYTDPSLAAEFVSRTGIDSLAVAIGTAHGVYKNTPKLDIARLQAIRSKVSVPLVLHGASGISDEVVRQCISEGICKVNFATELRIAYSDGVKEYLKENPDAFDPKSYGKKGYEKVKQLAMDKMTVCRNGK